MLDQTGLIIAHGVGEAARMTRVALVKSARDMADQLERNPNIQMTPAETLRFFADTVTKAWESV